MSDYDLDAIQASIESGDVENVPPEFLDVAEEYRASGAALSATAPTPVPTDGIPEANWQAPFNQMAFSEKQRANYFAKMAAETGATKDGYIPKLEHAGMREGAALYRSDVELDTLFGTIKPGQPFFLNRPGMSWQDASDLLDSIPAMVAGAALVPAGAALTATGAATGAAIGGLSALGAGAVVDASTDTYRGIGRQLFDAGVGALTEVGFNAAGDKLAKAMHGWMERGVSKLLGEKSLTQLPDLHVNAADNTLTPATAKALERAGIDLETIGQRVVAEMKADPRMRLLDPESAYNAAAAKSLGVEPMVHGITGKSKDAAEASKLASVFNESYSQFVEGATQKVRVAGRVAAGVPTDYVPNVPKIVQKAGDDVRTALGVGKSEMKRASDELFAAVEALSPQTRDVVLPSSKILAAVDSVYSDERFGLKAKFKTDGDHVKRVLTQYGIGVDTEAAKELEARPFNVDAARAVLEELNGMTASNPELSRPLREIHKAVTEQVTEFAESAIRSPSSSQVTAQQQLRQYKSAIANYKGFMGRWNSADLVYEILKPREDFSPLSAIRSSDIAGKIRASSKEDVRRFMVTLTDVSKSSDPEVSGAAMKAKESLRTAVVLEGLEGSIKTNDKTGQQYVDNAAFGKFFDSFDTGALEDVLTKEQLSSVKSMRRFMDTHRIGALATNAKIADPVSLDEGIKSHIHNAISTVWLAINNPIAWSAVLVGKTGLTAARETAVPRATKQALEGIKNVTSLKNLTRSQQETLLAEIAATYPKAAKYLSGSKQVIEAVSKSSRLVSGAKSGEAEYRTGGY